MFCVTTYNKEPKKVLPVLTAKHMALSASLCWCSNGSKRRCSTTPANTWYLLYFKTIPHYFIQSLKC